MHALIEKTNVYVKDWKDWTHIPQYSKLRKTLRNEIPFISIVFQGKNGHCGLFLPYEQASLLAKEEFKIIYDNQKQN